MLGGSVAASIEAVVFDFDGTLADTREVIVKTIGETLAAFDVPSAPREAVIARIGVPLAQILTSVGMPAAQLEAAVAFYRQRFPDNARNVVLFSDVPVCLRALTDAGMPLAIASSRGRWSLTPMLEQLAIASLFRVVLGDEDVVHKKPAPDLVLHAAARLGIAPERMLVVGDTTYDIEMGRAAGAYTCAVTYGSHDAQTLRGAQPMWLLDSLAVLPARLGL